MVSQETALLIVQITAIVVLTTTYFVGIGFMLKTNLPNLTAQQPFTRLLGLLLLLGLSVIWPIYILINTLTYVEPELTKEEVQDTIEEMREVLRQIEVEEVEQANKNRKMG